MMSDNIRKAGQLVNRNSPAILTAAGVTGTVMTAYLAAKAGWMSANAVRIMEEHEAPFEELSQKEKEERIKERIKLIWPLYIPPAASMSLTVASIFVSNRISSNRTAAAVSAYSITERAFAEYRDRVIEEIGAHKDQVIRDDIAAKTVENNPPSGQVIISGNGTVLCCELYTKRYFNSDMETLRKAQNDVNAAIMSDLYVSLDAFYDAVGLPHTSHSNELGWDSDKLLILEFSTVLADDGRPCLAFGYNYIKPI